MFTELLLTLIGGAAGAFLGMWVVDCLLARKRQREDAALIRGMLSSSKNPPTEP